MNKLIICTLYFLINSINIFSQDHRNIYVFEKNGKKGLINNKMKVIAEAKYENLGGYTISYRNKIFQDNLLDTWRLGNNYSFGSYIIFKYKDKYGVMNLDGKWVVEPKYHNELRYTAVSGIFRYEINSKFGLVNNKGEEFLKAKYDVISPEDKKNIIVKEENHYFLIDYLGNLLSEKLTHRIFSYDEKTKIFIYELNKKYGYKKINGDLVFEPIFSNAFSFFNGNAKVKKDREFGIINEKGNIIMFPNYKNIYNRDDFKGYFIINESYKYGLLDENLQEIINPEYDQIGIFNEGYAYVKKDNKFGFINKNGELIIPIMYDRVISFSEGLAPVKLDNKWGIININNDTIVDFKIKGSFFKYFSNGIIGYSENFQKWGFLNKKGELEIDAIYDKIKTKFINGVAIVYLKGDKYLINKSGEKFLLKSRNNEPTIMIKEERDILEEN